MNDTTKHKFKKTIDFLLDSIPKLNPVGQSESISLLGETIGRLGNAYHYIVEADKPPEGL